MNLQAWRPTDTPKLSCNTGDSVAKSSPGAGSAGNLSLIAEFIGPKKNLNFQFCTELHSPQKPYKKKGAQLLKCLRQRGPPASAPRGPPEPDA